MGDLPYHEFDPPIRGLCRVLNELPGIATTGSCGGHETPISTGSLPAEEWMVAFELEPWDAGALVAVPTREAWVSLEWLAWFINDDTDYHEMAERNPEMGEFAAAVLDRPHTSGVTLTPWSRPPYLYYPGRTLGFAIEGTRGDGGTEPDQLAEALGRAVDECYIPAEDTWPYEDQAIDDA